MTQLRLCTSKDSPISIYHIDINIFCIAPRILQLIHFKLSADHVDTINP